MTDSQILAKTQFLMKLIKGRDITIVWSWGARGWKYGIENENVFIIFRVSGAFHKGLVKVFETDGKFTVQLLKGVGGKKLSQEVDELPAELVNNCIDRLVEYTGDAVSYKAMLIEKKLPFVNFG